jgi:hypothetical protein
MRDCHSSLLFSTLMLHFRRCVGILHKSSPGLLSGVVTAGLDQFVQRVDGSDSILWYLLHWLSAKGSEFRFGLVTGFHSQTESRSTYSLSFVISPLSISEHQSWLAFPPKASWGWGYKTSDGVWWFHTLVRLYTKSMLETCPGLEDLVLIATFSHHDVDIYNTRLFQLKNFSSALNPVSIIGYLVQRNAAIFV